MVIMRSVLRIAWVPRQPWSCSCVSHPCVFWTPTRIALEPLARSGFYGVPDIYERNPIWAAARGTRTPDLPQYHYWLLYLLSYGGMIPPEFHRRTPATGASAFYGWPICKEAWKKIKAEASPSSAFHYSWEPLLRCLKYISQLIPHSTTFLHIVTQKERKFEDFVRLGYLRIVEHPYLHAIYPNRTRWQKFCSFFSGTPYPNMDFCGIMPPRRYL